MRMRNRAKCKKCHDVIESLTDDDEVECSCGEISVFGGDSLKCKAKSWDNFIRINDDDTEIDVKVNDTTRDFDINMRLLKDMIVDIESLPQIALTSPINHYDLLSTLHMIYALFKSKAKQNDIN